MLPVPPVVRDRAAELLGTVKRAILDHTQQEEAVIGQVNKGNSIAPMDISLKASSTNLSGSGMGIMLPDLWSLTSTRAGKRPTHELFHGFLLVVSYF